MEYPFHRNSPNLKTKLLTFYAQTAYLKRPCFCKCGIENRVKNLFCVYVCISHLKITHAYDNNERRKIYNFVGHDPPMFIILPIQLCMKQTDMNVPYRLEALGPSLK